MLALKIAYKPSIQYLRDNIRFDCLVCLNEVWKKKKYKKFMLENVLNLNEVSNPGLKLSIHSTSFLCFYLQWLGKFKGYCGPLKYRKLLR